MTRTSGNRVNRENSGHSVSVGAIESTVVRPKCGLEATCNLGLAGGQRRSRESRCPRSRDLVESLPGAVSCDQMSDG